MVQCAQASMQMPCCHSPLKTRNGWRGRFSQAVSKPSWGAATGQILRFVCREHFLAMKVYAGGPQDIEDARKVIATAGDSIDLALLRRLAVQYGRTAASSLGNLLAERR